ncbi:MAG: hypothetical protein H0T40_15675 [Geodermatophilaceae bacterium]|nr:hypothetical protein [Geodermatophilaceae bacterium]
MPETGTAQARSTATPPPGRAPERLPTGVAAAIRTPGFPLAIAFGHGSAWVSTHRATTLYRIDPRSNRVEAEIDVGRESCGRIEVTADAVWVVACEDGPSARVDPSSNQVVETTESGALPPVKAGGDLWQVLAGHNILARIDPATMATTARIPLGPLPGMPLVAFGAIWIPTTDGIHRIDVHTGKARTVRLGETDTDILLARAAGAIWVANGLDGVLWRVSPQGRAIRTSLQARPPSLFYDIGLAAGRGHLFLRSGDTRVWEVDPRTETIVARHHATGAGGHVAIGFGSLWAANAGDDSVWRIRLR